MDGRRGEAPLPLRRRRRRRAGRLPARSRTGHSPPRKRSKRWDFFDKKYCDICGEKIGLLGNRKLEDGNCCKTCARGLSPWFSERRHSTVDEIKAQLTYREENRDKAAQFRITQELGKEWRVLFDDTHGWFTVTRARNLAEENPDILDYSQLTGSRLDVDEDRCELKRQDKDGKQMSGKRRRRSPRPQRPARGPARHAAGQTPPNSVSTAVRRDPEKHLKRKGKTP